eukprot:TRINITY_DN6369_c0_g1_i3.p1 TRINITY_DN6369_c0_g1~~TRINITY_DN6369_c0_g1_i3.p1  ORF type:complete len:166 (-),score=11.28 TRINITY_DN6369_c0_g1_i3:235-732(-)
MLWQRKSDVKVRRLLSSCLPFILNDKRHLSQQPSSPKLANTTFNSSEVRHSKTAGKGIRIKAFNLRSMHKTNLTENHPHSALLPISLNATCVYSKSILNPIPNTEPFKLTANPFLNTKHTFTIEPSCSLVAPVKKSGRIEGRLGEAERCKNECDSGEVSERRREV